MNKIQFVLTSLEEELEYKYSKLILYSDMSGKIISEEKTLFSFFHVDEIVSTYMQWRKNTGGMFHKKE